ncbi:hypothetical protein JJB11_10840 [Ramlibacter ginsenosidimutans]|uniref:Uncharacterized protein n=1 Tax=Ramlibacter ginsenosidimutans TaxID=502333 RepID=A0A934WLB3_9BURK|nr:hypothetical protein [Ramlibacter ginsenosidimutans]MBK6006589.1 hypothetical protein [Ramlibacter ginsenosidimutans]
MNLLHKLFRPQRTGRRAPEARRSVNERRRQVLSTAVADTLKSHGIPEYWIGAETLPSQGMEGRGLHLRLIVRNTSPKLLANLFALQRAIQHRLSQVDALSAAWLAGTSWRIEVPFGIDQTELPGPEFWRSAAQHVGVHRRSTARSDRPTLKAAVNERGSTRAALDMHEFSPTQPMLRHG